ncbi:MAG: Hsp20/alpha crystallin family protein [Candidatus Binataceae bacterium]|jgi:HSP20 family protein
MALLRFRSDLGPASGLLSLQQELERFLRNPNYSLGLSAYGEFPPINVFADKDSVLVIAEAPGLDLKSLTLSSHGRSLTISGERKGDEPKERDSYHRRERPVGKFSRSIQLPEDLDLSKADAKYEGGLLMVRVPKAEESKPRQITIQAGR